jgi:hypothetical protein
MPTFFRPLRQKEAMGIDGLEELNEKETKKNMISCHTFCETTRKNPFFIPTECKFTFLSVARI